GLARFFEYVAVDSLDSSYRVWTNFMSEVFFQAMLADSQEGTHSVVQKHNGNIASILQSFDTITYCKGASVLRMLCHCVGGARFLESMRRFVVDHQYACATQEDLWKAVQGVCDRDGLALNVRDLMRPWLTRAMFPVLRVRMSAADTLAIVQEPFSFCALPRGGKGGGSGGGGGSGACTAAGAAAAGAAAAGVAAGAAAGPATGAAARSGQAGPQGLHRGTSGEGGGTARSTKMLRTAAPVSSRNRAPSGGGGGGGTWWVVPLRIRVASGSQAAPEQTTGGAAAAAAEGGWGRCGGGSGGLPGEAVHSFLMAEESTSITLRGLSRERREPREAAHGSENGVGAGAGAGGEGRPYLVVNDGHSGFFSVQYECERSWALAIAAVREGVLNECETMGFVYDLILGLHRGVLGDRESASWDIAGGCSEGRGGGDGDGDCSSCCGSCCTSSWNVPRLFSRLKDVVRLLRRDRGQPAWCAGQLFLWELLVMCASDVLSEVCELSLRRRRLAPPGVDGAAAGQAGREQKSQAAGGAVSKDRVMGEGEAAGAADSAAAAAASAVSAASAASAAPAAAADSTAAWFAAGAEWAAAQERLSRIAADVERALEDVKEDVRWHRERVASGVEHANEALQSLRGMRERLRRSRLQMTLVTKM
ncbi:unnamed protein product, partial [Laminaria digitata]